MDFNNYQSRASKNFKEHKGLTKEEARLLDWALGVTDEAGEVAGKVKHMVYHNEETDIMEIAKEIGDVLWYLSALAKTLDISLEDCAELNVAKLEHRHGKKGYSDSTSASRHSKENKFKDTELYKDIERRVRDGFKG